MTEPGAGFPVSPASELHATFARIAATRMAGLPVCNPALKVEVVGMQRWAGEWLSALITPWALNLMLLPGGGGHFRPLAVGQTQRWRFPSGEYVFSGQRETGLGAYQSCSLFSPVFEFASQAEAVAVAGASLAALLQVHAPHPDAAAHFAGQAPPNLSRRHFLGGGTGGDT